MANPYRDDKTGKYTTKAKFEEQSAKSAKSSNEVDREGLNIAKEQNQLLREQNELRREAKSLSRQILDDYETEVVRREEGLDHPRSELDLEQKIIKAKARQKNLDYEIQEAEKLGDDYSKGILIEAKGRQDELLKGYEKEADVRDDLNEKMGAMGNLMGAIEDIPFARHFYDGEEALESMEKAALNKKSALIGLFNSMKKGIMENKQLLSAMWGAASVKSLFDDMMALSEQTTEFQKGMGLSSKQALQLRQNMGAIAAETENMAVQSGDVAEAINNINAQFGTASTVIRDDVVGEIAVLQETTGLSAEAAGRFASSMMKSGQHASVVTEQARQAVRATADEFGVRLNVNEVLEEAGKITGEMAANMGYNVVAISKAIAVAKQFGMTMKDVASASSSLLDFNTSIENELQAELYTGKQLNLEKARLAALTGDYETLTREINENMADEHEWSMMNVKAKEKMAAALGMTSDQMSDIIYAESNLAELAKEAEERGDYAAAKDLQARSMQQQMNDLREKGADILVTYVAPALDFISNLMSSLAENSWILYGVLGAMAVIKLGGLIAGLVSLGASLAAAGIGSAALMSGLTLGLGAAAIIGGIVLIGNAISKANKSAKKDLQDGIIDSDGSLMVSGPKGSIQLDKDDQIIAGTDLGIGKNKTGIEDPQTLEVSSTVNPVNQNQSLDNETKAWRKQQLELLQKIHDANLAAGLGGVGVIAYSAFNAVKKDKHYETKYR